MVLSRTSPVMQKTRSLASVGRWRRPQTTNLAMNGTRMISGYSSDAMRAASPALGVSTSQKLKRSNNHVAAFVVVWPYHKLSLLLLLLLLIDVDSTFHFLWGRATVKRVGQIGALQATLQLNSTLDKLVIICGY